MMETKYYIRFDGGEFITEAESLHEAEEKAKELANYYKKDISVVEERVRTIDVINPD